MISALIFLSFAIWLTILLLPWRPWGTAQRLPSATADISLSDVTVLIPARNEAECVAETLRQVAAQGALAKIVLVDDQSDDGTATAARTAGIDALQIVDGTPPPPGWSGKLWALEQGRTECATRLTLLLDADIGLSPGVLNALLSQMNRGAYDLVSVMANLPMRNGWEKLLLPAFIYFFKLLYPFSLANDPRSRVAAAAGGCVLIKTARLDAIGGFAALHDAIIDDCALARYVKRAGGRTWLGLSNEVRAIRPYTSLRPIWDMVARTAYTQLRYSPAWLLLCSVLMIVVYIVPIVGLVSGRV